MSLNKEIIFGLSSLGDDDMLFPDFNRRLYSGSSWTATEDCFIVGSDYESDNSSSPSTPNIDGVTIGHASKGNYSFLSAYVAKGTVIRYASFSAYGLKKGGVRVSSYHIVSLKSKSKKENLCH